MDWERIVTELLIALVPLLTMVLTAAIAYGAAYLRQRNAWLKEARTVDAVEDQARDTVLALQQTLVDELKAAKADGKLTDEEKAAIKAKALERLESKITESQAAILAAITGDVSAWLADRIERVLVEHKLDVAATGGAGVLIEANPIEPAAD
jgi:rRNA-processing protein FCF1